SGASQVCRAFQHLPKAIRSAATFKGKDSCTITGDLPPNSSNTGVRFLLASAITIRPTSVDPVNVMWSKGSVGNATEISPCPVITATCCSVNMLAIMALKTSLRRGVELDILIVTRLPAASAYISGPMDKKIGEFQGTITPTTPSG